ncbi:MAG TPA: glycoside hydrolase family 2 TIM barrel-domain containing protein [Anaerolineae bacterium]|nr:glycoside hydrolase family 2 TIM barrel-domain containing protein [Anaerolineae bacterium]
MDKAKFVLGVNYWPRRTAIAFWRAFDAGEVREDFALCAELGLSVIRIFLLWDDWQPQPDVVSRNCLRSFEKVCDLAASSGLGLDVTFFTGHMSGPNWPTRWLLDPLAPRSERPAALGSEFVDCGYRNPYVDGVALRAETLLLHTVVGAFRQHPAIWMWNLGNEPDLFARPPDHFSGQQWVRLMTETIRAVDEDHPVTCGLHVDSLVADNHLRIDEVFGETDVAVMHAYPMYASWARQPLDPDFVPFTCALTSALCGKPTLAEEWGGCTAPRGAASVVWEWEVCGKPHRQFMASEEALADYVAQVLPRLQAVGSPGALLWCFADYDPSLYDRPFCNEWRHERHFGLVRPDGSLKPHAVELRRFALTQPMARPASRTVTLDVTSGAYYQNPLEHAERLYCEFVSGKG